LRLRSVGGKSGAMTGPVQLGDMIRDGKLFWCYCRDCYRERDLTRMRGVRLARLRPPHRRPRTPSFQWLNTPGASSDSMPNLSNRASSTIPGHSRRCPWFRGMTPLLRSARSLPAPRGSSRRRAPALPLGPLVTSSPSFPRRAFQLRIASRAFSSNTPDFW